MSVRMYFGVEQALQEMSELGVIQPALTILSPRFSSTGYRRTLNPTSPQGPHKKIGVVPFRGD